MSSLEAVSTAAVLYNTWGAQAETAQQHDDELQVRFLIDNDFILKISCDLYQEKYILFTDPYSLHSNHRLK